jgi:hypothetical protein
MYPHPGSSRSENSSGFMRTKILIHYGGSILYMAWAYVWWLKTNQHPTSSIASN